MSVQSFLSAVLPTQGLRFVLCQFGQQGDPDFRPGQKHFEPTDMVGLQGYAAWGTRMGANVFFAVGGFDTVLKDDGLPARTAAACRWHRSLRIDIDVGANKPYASKRDALVALLQFNQTYSLPTPWIVDSGGGLHVYWTFDRDVDTADWLPLAARLRAACEEGQLEADHTSTTDAARILRMPGTKNNKPHFAANPPEVTILQQGVACTPEQLVVAMPAATAPAMRLPAALRGLGSELTANLHEPYFLRGVLLQCPGMAAMLADGGARAAEPLWKRALDLINKSDDPEPTKIAVARAVSRGHSGFSEESFQRKWATVQQQDYHPPRCEQMASAGLPECSVCPMRGKISSPLVVGRITPMAPSDAAVPPPPAPPAENPPAALQPTPPPTTGAAPAVAPTTRLGIFELDGSATIAIIDGKLTSRLSIADGFPVVLRDTPPDDAGVRKQYNAKLLEYRMLAVERMLDRDHRKSMVVITFDRGNDGRVSIEFDHDDFSEPRKFYGKLSAEGIYCSRKDSADFLDKFMTEFLIQLQRARAANRIVGRCGWTDGFESFVLGTTIYHRNGTSEPIRTGAAPGEMEGYHIAGDEAAWRRAFDIAMSGGIDRQCVLALAIAAPLMPFTGLDGVMLNAYSPESGVGKSTLCDAALSLWGSPNALRKDFRDTSNATFKLATVMGNMPMVVDEFTNVEGKALSDYVYTITQGREKHRLTSDARLNTNGQNRWCLAAIATSNNSVHDKLQDYRPDATAEAARVFEMRLHPLRIDPARMGEIKSHLYALRDSYGFMGPRLVREFLAVPADFWREVVSQLITKWDQQAAEGAGDRFRSALCALTELGAIIGAKLGYGFDSAAVAAEMRMHWSNQVVEFNTNRKTAEDFINAYVLEHAVDFATMGGPEGKDMINQMTPRKIRGEIRGKTKDGKFAPATLMLPLSMVREFVRERNGNFKTVLEWARASPAMLRIGNLMYLQGTRFQMVTPSVEFDFNTLLHANAPALQVITDNAQTHLEKVQ